MRDPYWTEARRQDHRALQFEPYGSHQIDEKRLPGGYRYLVSDHPDYWWTPIEARAAVDRCIADLTDCPGGKKARELAADPFARFDR